MLICSERKVLLAGSGWFVLREKYCCLVADKPNEQADEFSKVVVGVGVA
jgi:hypothetical protein